MVKVSEWCHCIAADLVSRRDDRHSRTGVFYIDAICFASLEFSSRHMAHDAGIPRRKSMYCVDLSDADVSFERTCN